MILLIVSCDSEGPPLLSGGGISARPHAASASSGTINRIRLAACFVILTASHSLEINQGTWLASKIFVSAACWFCLCQLRVQAKPAVLQAAIRVQSYAVSLLSGHLHGESRHITFVTFLAALQ